jgi:hypothetical protein
VCSTIGNKSDGERQGQVEGPDPTGCADGDKKAKAEKQEAVVAAGAKSITDSVGRGRHGAQYGRYNHNIRICVAVPDRRKASYIGGETMLLELFPLIASAMAALSFLALTAEERYE